MSLQKKVLAYAWMTGDITAPVSYSIMNGVRYASKAISDEEIPELKQEFRRNPEQMLVNMVGALDEIKKDSGSSPSRLKRYFEAYKELLLFLDFESFERSDIKVYRGIPEYVPDGLSDLGSDPSLDGANRGRKKIIVNKRKIFNLAQPVLDEIISQDEAIISRDSIKKVINFVHDVFPYDLSTFGHSLGSDSVDLTNYSDSINPKAVCRHHALYGQVLLQSLGVPTRLLKCNVEFSSGVSGAHVSNLFNFLGDWYLADITNPVVINGESKLAIVPVNQKTIDINNKRYNWNINVNGGTRSYMSRNNMYYRLKETF